eukprot:2988062-Pyramimonas_sp.AAC.1
MEKEDESDAKGAIIEEKEDARRSAVDTWTNIAIEGLTCSTAPLLSQGATAKPRGASPLT